MAHSVRSFFFGPVALAILVALLFVVWPATVSGKKSRRKGKAKKKEERSEEDTLYLEKHMGPSEYWEEIEADNFKKKVFRKDKDVVIFFYGDAVPHCLAARSGVEQLGELVKKTNPNVRTMRIDDLRFGLDLATKHKDLKEDFELGTTLPRMYLVRAYEKKPIRFPQKDMYRGELLAMFLVDKSSFRKEFGFEDWANQRPPDSPEQDFNVHGSVGSSKHYKELLPTDFPRYINPRERDVFLVHYADTSKKSQASWKALEKAAVHIKKKTQELLFARIDVRHYDDTESKDKSGNLLYDPTFAVMSKNMPPPYGLYISSNVSKSVEVLPQGTIRVYGLQGIMEFLVNHSSHLLATHDEL